MRTLAFLSICIAGALLGACRGSSSLPPWKHLSTRDRSLWSEVIPAARAAGLDPRDSYAIAEALRKDARSGDSPTTLSLPAERFVALDVAGGLLRRREAAAVEEPTTATLAAWMKERPRLFPPVEQIELDSIYCRALPRGGIADARRRASEAVKAIEGGMSFEEAAERWSDARSRGLGGRSGTIRRQQLPAETEAFVFGMREGEVRGGFERPHGVYVFRVARRHAAARIEDQETRTRAAKLWRDQKANERLEAIVEQFRVRHGIEVVQSPDGKSSLPWEEQPWITRKEGAPETFALAYLALARQDLALQPHRRWSAEWEEGTVAAAPAILVGLAAEELGLMESEDFAPALRLAQGAQKSEDALRRWFSELQPSEAELRAWFGREGDRRFPPIPSYDAEVFFVWVKEAEGAQKSERLEKLVRAMDSALPTTAPRSPEEAVQVLGGLKTLFPDGELSSLRGAESLSPWIDPILKRTAVGTLSLPFDTPEGAGVLFVTSRKDRRATLPEVREVAIEVWKKEKLQQRVTAILASHEE